MFSAYACGGSPFAANITDHLTGAALLTGR
jgi:hypothetical protein